MRSDPPVARASDTHRVANRPLSRDDKVTHLPVGVTAHVKAGWPYAGAASVIRADRPRPLPLALALARSGHVHERAVGPKQPLHADDELLRKLAVQALRKGANRAGGLAPCRERGESNV